MVYLENITSEINPEQSQIINVVNLQVQVTGNARLKWKHVPEPIIFYKAKSKV